MSDGGSDACTNVRAARLGVAQSPGEGVSGMSQLTSNVTYVFPFDHHDVFWFFEYAESAGNLYGFSVHGVNTLHRFDCKREKQRHSFDLFLETKATKQTGCFLKCTFDKVLIISRVLSCPKFYSKHRHGDKVPERGMGWQEGGCRQKSLKGL